MRPTLIVISTAAALFATTLAATAQGMSRNERFCAQQKDSSGYDSKPACLYRTMEECREAVKENGNCIRNPNM